MELSARLEAYPKMKAALSELPPKMLALSRDKPPEPLALQGFELEGRVDEVMDRLARAKFSNPSDGDIVPPLYRDYVTRIAGVLQKALGAFASGASAGAVQVCAAAANSRDPGCLVLALGARPAPSDANRRRRSSCGRRAGQHQVWRGRRWQPRVTHAGGWRRRACLRCVRAGGAAVAAGRRIGMALLRSVEGCQRSPSRRASLQANVQALRAEDLREEQLVRVREEAERVGEAMAQNPLRREAAGIGDASPSLNELASRGVDAAIKALGIKEPGWRDAEKPCRRQ